MSESGVQSSMGRHRKLAASTPRVRRQHSSRRRAFTFALIAVSLFPVSSAVTAQERPDTARRQEPWDVTQPRGKTREIDFTTNEGTWMSVSLSPDGQWVVFDLLAHIYRVPAAGGEAQVLTQNTGVATNFHPRISPDGKLIAFVSDRRGQNNLWVMGIDGSNPRAIFTDNNVRVTEPAWSADGEYVLVRRQQLTPPGAPPGGSGIWMYHRNGGEGVELVPRTQPGAAWPAASRDGRFVYFHVTPSNPPYAGWRDALGGAAQVRRLDIKTGEISAVTAGEQSQQVQSSSGGGLAPEVSPDGRWLAFARRVPDGTISYKGHKFGPRTALWLRDLQTGQERLLMDPIELDMVETFKTLRALPGYSWSADGRSIVIGQAGKLRRLDVASGRVTDIPFTARVRRTISEQAYATGRITDEPFQVRFARWQTASPDGRTLAFQAVGRIWLMSLPNGTPRRLTAATFAPFEYAPAWSPDGRWLAFTSWDDTLGGHLWKVAVGNESRAPIRLTVQAGEYIHPAWSPNGREIVLARGAGETARGRGMLWNAWYDLVRVDAAAGTPGAATLVTQVTSATDGSASAFTNIRNQIVRPSYGPDGRVFFPHLMTNAQGQTTSSLISVRPDGSDRRTHLTFPYADEIVPSPDGKWVAFQEADNVYLTPLPYAGTGAEPVRIEKRRAKLPVRTLSKEGGLFPRWRNDTTVEFGSGNHYFAHRVGASRTDTMQIRLTVPRDIPSGTIALTGARVITLADRRVLDNATLVVRRGRIACVGDCPTTGADRVVDASGKTIIPGFIDVHSHNFREHRGIIPQHNYETAVFLAYGITTTMDPSMWSQNIFPTGEMTDAGLIVGSRVFSTGDPLYAYDGSRQDDMASYEVAQATINRLASWGAISLKQYLQPRRDQRQWVTDVARKRGLLVTSENNDIPYTIGMLMDGHTGFEHPMSYLPLYSDFTTFLGKAKAVYSPTFMVGGAGPWNEEFFYAEAEQWKDEKQRRFLPWRQLVPQTRRRMLRPVTDYSFPMMAQGLADVIAAGGYGAIGAHGQHNGPGSHWEVWMAASALGPMGALEIASAHGAYFIGRSADLGSIEVGKLADLIVLNSNPLDNIRNTMDIRYVMKGGVLYDDDTLDEIWPRQRKYGPYYWVNEDVYKADDKVIK